MWSPFSTFGCQLRHRANRLNLSVGPHNELHPGSPASSTAKEKPVEPDSHTGCSRARRPSLVGGVPGSGCYSLAHLRRRILTEPRLWVGADPRHTRAFLCGHSVGPVHCQLCRMDGATGAEGSESRSGKLSRHILRRVAEADPPIRHVSRSIVICHLDNWPGPPMAHKVRSNQALQPTRMAISSVAQLAEPPLHSVHQRLRFFGMRAPAGPDIGPFVVADLHYRGSAEASS